MLQPAHALVQVFFVAVCLGLAPVAPASEPLIRFDFAQTAACSDVTPEGFEATHPEKKLVEVPLELSVHLDRGEPGRIEEVRVVLSDADRRMRVEAFSPETTLESEFSDDIQVTTTNETNKSIGASLGGEAPVVFGDVVANLTPSIKGSFAKADIETRTAYRRPPKQALVVAGTVDSAHGVSFKLRPSPQTTLEGVHEFVVRFVVPANWRADELDLHCSATGTKKVLWVKQPTTWAERRASLAVYLSGDAEARQAAERYARSVARR